jgi:hypothetical protein
MYTRFSRTVSTCRKSTARIPAAWACKNCRHVGPERRGAGSMPAARRISHTVDGATVTPSFVSSPWIRRCPHSGFSLASRTTRRAMPGTVGGRPLACVVLAASELALPGQERRRRHREDPGPASARQEPCHRSEPHPVGRVIPYPADIPAQHRVLVPEYEQLGVFARSARNTRTAKHPARQQVDDLEQHPASRPPLHPSCRQQCR